MTHRSNTSDKVFTGTGNRLTVSLPRAVYDSVIFPFTFVFSFWVS